MVWKSVILKILSSMRTINTSIIYEEKIIPIYQVNVKRLEFDDRNQADYPKNDIFISPLPTAYQKNNYLSKYKKHKVRLSYLTVVVRIHLIEILIFPYHWNVKVAFMFALFNLFFCHPTYIFLQ